MKKIIIALDGHSSCGKSTLARALAKKLGYTFIDSGAMYRAVALYFKRHNIDHHDADAVQKALDDIHITFVPNALTGTADTYLNNENVENQIRQMEVANHVSKVSIISAVRRHLVKQQQKMGENKGIVMDGRDIGTVVFPQAELKIFLTASPEIRTQRRLKELQEKGMTATYEEVMKNLTERDYIDSTREDSPLKKADDAIVLDNTNITKEEQFELALKWATERINGNAHAIER